MRNHRSLWLVVVFFSQCSYSQPAKRVASDGVEFPPVSPLVLAQPITLPLFNNVFAEAPETVAGKNEILSASRSHARVRDWAEGKLTYQLPSPLDVLERGPFSKNRPSQRELLSSKYFGIKGMFKADVVVLRLEEGRVIELFAHYLRFSGSDAQELRKVWKGLIVNDLSVWPGFSHAVLNAVGGNNKSIKVHYKLTRQTMPGGGDAASWPAVLQLTIDPVEWYLLFHKVDPVIEKAARAEELVNGMSRELAFIIIDLDKRYYERTQKYGGARVTIEDHGPVVFSKRSEYWKDQRVTKILEFAADDTLMGSKVFDKEAKDAKHISDFIKPISTTVK